MPSQLGALFCFNGQYIVKIIIIIMNKKGTNRSIKKNLGHHLMVPALAVMGSETFFFLTVVERY